MAWDACLPGEVEDHAYYRACEEAAAASGIGLRMAAIVVEQSEEVVAVAPLFRLNYRLDMPLQGRLRRLGEALFRRLPGVLTLQTLCVGSPYSERCHLGFSPRLDTVGRIAALECMIATLQRQAAAERVQLLVWKDLSPGQEQDAATLLNRARFARLASLPIAVLDLPYTDEAAYLASLSPATRKDIRRKLAKAWAVRLEYRSDIAGLEGEIDTLYESTRRQSALDYRDLELLPPGYFAAISPALGERAVFALYWVGTELVAFNLLLVEADRVIDKFLGMRYPLAREHNIYAVSWMANVRFCITRGISLLQSGQTAYASKLRFGSSLVTSTVYVRHCNTPLQWVLRRLSPWLGFDRFDPDLAEWARRGRLREGAKTYSKLRQRNERAV